ncbi:hypothetical protein HOLleu_13921 [Holothuria leucospilota]|uniref:CCHC-type domain-containing protein n=1 Tax=Holothuria leucospilota TaxID=206669 RepID=A0A9Q1C7E9_HOLLE|nr:hypothetical protein HOLleu_13921 [Holothuria leucospilota]
MEESQRIRRSCRRDVARDIENLKKAVTEGEPREFLTELYNDLKKSWELLKTAHDGVMSHVKEGDEEKEEETMDDIRKSYTEVRKLLYRGKANEGKEVNDKKPSLQLKKMEMPKFSGDVKLYSRFKEDFNKFVKPATHTDQLAFTLRQCLSGEPLRVVVPAEDDVNKIWQRLDERVVKEGDDRKLVEFIDLVEASYRNLERAGLQGEMANSRVIGEIEKKLPEELFKRWARHMNDKEIKQEGRMQGLLAFLEYIIQKKPTCVIHEKAQHHTESCRAYQAKSIEKRIEPLKEKRACFRCLKVGHVVIDCRSGVCGKDGCKRKHHPSIHFQRREADKPDAGVEQYSAAFRPGDCMLMVTAITAVNGATLNTVFDSGATASVVTHKAARRIGAKGVPVTITVTKVGREEVQLETKLYEVELRLPGGREVALIKAYGMVVITKDLKYQKIEHLARVLEIEENKVTRPVGKVDLLIGLDHADLHPQKVRAVDHLVLFEGPFGCWLGGRHPVCENEVFAGIHLTQVGMSMDQFLTIESLGVSCNPKCGGCKCGKCPPGAKEYTLQEERELDLIENGLKFKNNRWEAKYPWVKDPKGLPDNRVVAVAKVKPLEKRLSKDKEEAKMYSEQVQDMIERGVAREIPEAEVRGYEGPVHYIAHHAVRKPESDSTPLRIVFNSSANYKGHVLNDYWANGPDLNNQLIAVLMRFRKERVALVGDIRKMYHSVGITLLDQHCHRFLWRGMEVERPLKTYCVTSVNFGDKPAATIAICALRKTAEMSKSEFPEAADTLKRNVYIDDVLDSLGNESEALERSRQIDAVLEKGNFKIKEWTISGAQTAKSPRIKVLGLDWDPVTDQLWVAGEEIPVQGELTKRKCLSVMNSVFDPLDLLSPVTVRAKILLRDLWGKGLDWDELIDKGDQLKWQELFRDLNACSNIKIPRCIKPFNSRDDVKPMLIMFSDASEKAMGTVAYSRYECDDGSYSTSLLASKSRVAPIRITSVVRLELSAALISARLAKTIMEETGIDFQRVLYLVDSEIVRAMIQKRSYGFKTFVATRIGEIQELSDPQDWWWVSGGDNVADIISRGLDPKTLRENGLWQNGPHFLQLPVEQWPVSQRCTTQEMPERVCIVMATDFTESQASPVEVERYSDFRNLLRVTAMLSRVAKQKSFRSEAVDINSAELCEAESFWITEAQWPLVQQMRKDPTQFFKGYGSLGPKLRDDGVIVVCERVKNHVQFSYSQEMVPLLPNHHHFTRLYALMIHNEGHNGVSTDMAKIRSKYWVIRLKQLVTNIRHKCVKCRKYDGQASEQKMAPLPGLRLNHPLLGHMLELICLDLLLFVERSRKEARHMHQMHHGRMGVTESLIGGVKRALFHVIGEQVLTREELQTVFSEVSNSMNSRPIGQHPTSPEEGTYLCPNNLLLGRSSVENPGGPWNDGGGHSKRLRFIQLLIDDFWRRWTRYYFPTLIVRKKWHTGKRNLQIGDYVLVQDNGARRGQWRTGRVSKVYPDDDGLVRKVELKTCSESGTMSYIRRAIQGLVLLIPVEEQ